MTGKQFERALAQLGLTKRGSARRLFHVSERTTRKWSIAGPPDQAALALELMLRCGIKADRAERAAAAWPANLAALALALVFECQISDAEAAAASQAAFRTN